MPVGDTLLSDIRDLLTHLLVEVKMLRTEFEAVLAPPAAPAPKAPTKKTRKPA